MGCALGVCLLAACNERQFPKTTLVYRHERDSRSRDHRVELWLTHSRSPNEAGPARAFDPVFSAIDPCPWAPYCEARELLVEEAERRFLWIDPLLEDEALELRFDDVMPMPAESP